MNVLSLFDGISCAKVALERAKINIKSYTACEIDKYAIQVSKKNHPTVTHIGNVEDLKDAIPVDILIGGSPCQDLSIAKKDRKGLEGNRSSLFWEYVRIKNLCNPKWFVLENVASMKKSDRDIITKALGVEPIMIDASLVSAQSRKRLFWTNIPHIIIPDDRNITVNDILEEEVDEKYYLKNNIYTANDNETGYIGFIGNSNSQGNRVYSTDSKSVCLSANGGGLGAKTGLYKINNKIRRLTPIECERLQGLPNNYTSGISDTQRYKCLGNAFNVDVVTSLIKCIPNVLSG
jgi:DNA (cytosine-5)-methyltransferase 3A